MYTDEQFKGRARDVRLAFVLKRRTVEARGVTWRLSLEEFAQIWRPHWHTKRTSNLVLCRQGDAGAYEVGNVRIDTRSNALKEWHARVNAAREIGNNPYYTQETDPRSLPARLDRFQARALLLALARAKGNFIDAAAALGVSLEEFNKLAMRYPSRIDEDGIKIADPAP